MPWWGWLLVSIVGAYALCGVLLLGAVAIGVKYFAWREGRKASARTEMEK